ncbi:MAG: alpha/beta hydrolase-fold protein [Lachnospiraceae bacterium]|nr:hypothetical protein [Lachnospiraceae bacterium]MDO4206655.1 alpha/beta hydrolase-fold protein [Lachnospiraceae bacterium]
MSIYSVNFLSRELGLHTKVNVILPTGRPMKAEKKPRCKYQVLWLLHGGSDDENDFVLNTNIARYADENCIAVVIPEDHDAFYTDGFIANHGRYFTYTTEELVRMCRSIFPLSEKREDNFVAGNSMGSGGAMKCAMLHPELYGAALMLSGSGMRMHREEDKWVAPFLKKIMNGEDVSDYPKIENPKEDVQMAIPIYEILKKGTENLPKMFFTCGDKDEWVLPDVRLALEYYKFMGLDYFYEEVPGYKHEWDFWDMQLRKALKEWLPLRHAPIYEGEEEA